jgi:hypothetical protein
MELNGSTNLDMNGAKNFCLAPVDGAASELRQRLREMEEDQEELNNSLMALTSHFAKVKKTYIVSVTSSVLFFIPFRTRLHRYSTGAILTKLLKSNL